MKKEMIALLSFTVILLFGVQIVAIACPVTTQTQIKLKNGLIISPNALNIPDWKKNYIEERTTRTHYKPEDVFQGYTLFNCDWDRRKNQSDIIVDLSGKIIAGIEGIGGGPELINSTTLMTDNRTHVIFWNMETNKFEYIPIPEGIHLHHDLEYDPKTDHFLYLGHENNGTVEVNGKNETIIHDTITLADRHGNILWHWRTYDHIPFNITQYYLYNLTSPRGTGADWVHGNTVFWDLDEGNIVYYNARHLNTMYKIDMTTGKILWALGAYNGNFTLYDKYGHIKPSLFYGAHSLEKIAPNTFIIYDNDFYNITDLSSHTPRIVVFQVDEKNWVARELWSWEVPDNNLYIGDHWGDADLLPDGTYLATFGAGGKTDNDYITEVNTAGKIVWELAINGTDTYRAERFYASPLIKLSKKTFSISDKDSLTFNITAWNSFKERRRSSGTLDVFNGEKKLLSKRFYFLPYWQPTNITINLPSEILSHGFYNLTLTIINEDGLSTSLAFAVTVHRASALSLFLATLSLIVASGLLYKKSKKSKTLSF